MKILLISSNSSSSGGGEQYLVYLGKGLSSHGERVIALISEKIYMNPWKKRLANVGVEVARENLIGLRNRPLRLFESLRDRSQVNRVANICRQIEPDIIHVNQQYDADGLDYVMGAIEYGRAPVVGTIHMPMCATRHPRSPLNPRTWFINLFAADGLKRQVLRKWYKTYNYEKIFPSKAMHDEFVAVYGGAENAHVVSLGIDLDKLPDYRSANSNTIKVFGFCGRLEPQKDPFMMINAWLKMLKKGIRSRLVIIGDGSMEKNIAEKLKRSAPVDLWKITGWVESPLEYLSGIDILVLPSHFEGLSTVAIEAACMGKQCVLAPNHAANELKEKIPWLFIAGSHTESALSDSMADALSAPPPEQDNVMAVQSYFSCKRMAKDTLDIYRNIKGG